MDSLIKAASACVKKAPIIQREAAVVISRRCLRWVLFVLIRGTAYALAEFQFCSVDITALGQKLAESQVQPFGRRMNGSGPVGLQSECVSDFLFSPRQVALLF